jgi:hypothetical protein
LVPTISSIVLAALALPPPAADEPHALTTPTASTSTDIPPMEPEILDGIVPPENLMASD